MAKLYKESDVDSHEITMTIFEGSMQLTSLRFDKQRVVIERLYEVRER